MSSPSTSPADTSESRLPRRDWILLPFIGLLTMVTACAATELVARHMYSEVVGTDAQCQHFKDPYIGIERPASCVFQEKLPETELVEHRLDSRGYRNDTEMTPKQPGTFRIVLVGSSFGVGGEVQRNQSIAAILPKLLSQHLGRKVEIYNASVRGFPGLPQSLNRRFSDVLDAQPDLVLWLLTRWDVKSALDTSPERENGGVEAADAGHPVETQAATDTQPRGLSFKVRAALASWKQVFLNSKSSYLLRELVFKSQSQFVKQSLHGPDDIVGYFKADPSVAWQDRLYGLDESVAAISDKASAAHVPLVVALLPNSIDANMISLGEWPSDDNPYLLTKEVDAIVARHGAVPLDVATQFRTIPNPERDYFPVDEHPNVAGNTILSQILARQLETSGLIPRAGTQATSQESRK